MAHQIMVAEGITSLTKLVRSRKAALEKPVQVVLQEGETQTYTSNSTKFAQLEMAFAKAAPLLPRPDLYTRTQQTRT